MRISTNQIYERSLNSILTQQAKASQLQALTSGRYRVESPSDDPIAAAQIEWMTQRINTTQLLQQNRQNAVNALSEEDATLNSTINTLQRLRDLQVQAGDSALSGDDRKALSVEANILLKQLQDLANSKDLNGDYMFSGAQTQAQPITVNNSGVYVYNGDSTQRFQVVTESLQIAINDTADNLFMRIPGGNGVFAVGKTGTANTGTAAVTTGSVVNPSVYVADNYTMSFALNTQGNLVVMVSGAVSGNVIPPSGLPDDAPLFQEGSSVNFNGMEMTVSGAPQPGDTFSITPAQNTSVFSTIQRMIANLNLPFNTAVDKAATQTENNQLLAQLDSAITNISNNRSDLGARLQLLDNADTINSNIIFVSEASRKVLREVDLVAAATEYNLQLVNLQAAQQSFTLIQGLSVFNYL